MERKFDEIENLYYRELHELQFEEIDDEEFLRRKEYLNVCINNLMSILSEEGRKAFLRYEEAESAVEAYLQFYNFKKGFEYEKDN